MPDANSPTPPAPDAPENAPAAPRALAPLDPRRLPRPRLPADPGTPNSRLVALVAAVIFAGAAIVMQNWDPVAQLFAGPPKAQSQTQSQTESQAESQAEADARVDAGASPFVDMLARIYVKIVSEGGTDPTVGEEALSLLDQFSASESDALHIAVAAAELAGTDEAVARLTTLVDNAADPADDTDAADSVNPADESTPTKPSAANTERAESAAPAPPPPLSTGDAARALLGIYAPDRFPPPDDSTRDRLTAQHGDFARLALTHADPAATPEGLALRSGGLAIVAAGFAFLLLIVGVFLAGVALLVTALVMLELRRLRPRFTPPALGGSVYLETYALFVGGFVFLQLAGEAALRMMGPAAAPGVEVVGLAAQWLLLLTPLWPLVRGVTLKEWRLAVGFHTGRGLFREIGAGIVGYVAGFPLLIFGAAVTVGLITLAELIRAQFVPGDPPPPSSPVLDLIGSADPLRLVLIVTLATVWAPFCEELIFRGCLQRHLRQRLPAVVCAFVAACLFAFMHGYGPLFAGPLIALGFTFSLMREWRGSIIPCITAHMLHNGTVMLLLFTLLRVFA